MREFDKEKFKKNYAAILLLDTDKRPEDCTDQEAMDALTKYVAGIATDAKLETTQRHIDDKSKKVYYFSMEFLIGPLLENYLVNLGILEEVREALSEMGICLDDLLKLDVDPGLGNGGLGRLAACFLDSMASLGIGGVGLGLRYEFGLFKQRIESGYQIEEPDDWLKNGYPWETAMPGDSIEVRFGGVIDRYFENGKLKFVHRDYDSVLAVPYLVPILGYEGRECNALHLYRAKSVNTEIDLEAFNRGDYAAAMRKQSEAKALTSILYPNDNSEPGKILRLKQEYFLVCAGVESIFRTYKKRFVGEPWRNFPDHVSIHTNDTHPALVIPELMRRLMDEEGLEWDEAWDITTRTVGFTNHTVLPEALEKWPQALIQRLLPRIYMIIEEIDNRWRASIPAGDNFRELHKKTAVLWGGEARMANLSIIGSHSVNGVSAIHSSILEKDVFKEFYTLQPWKFSNKTNGVSPRRFLMQANPALSSLISEYIGEGWKKDLDELEKLRGFMNDDVFLEKLAGVKKKGKERLAAYVAEKQEMALDTDSIFDVQVKRIHAYKRQLLMAFKILNLYNRIKLNPNYEMPPVTFIVGGKAAPGYDLAKEIIKFVCAIADKVNSDPIVSKKMKVVFIENYCISNAQLIYPASDISEQISTAGKEASGTGNMKFMMNGAVTLGTMDGANIEIFERCGYENAKVFGMNADEVYALSRSGEYRAIDEADSDPELRLMVNQLVDGTFDDCGQSFWHIYDSLISANDQYFVLRDFPAYFKAWEELVQEYRDKKHWQQMSLANIAGSGFFSSDRTIKEYAKEVWGL